MTSQFLFTDKKAFTLYGIFMALAYMTPVLGGWMSDQILGLRKSVLMGGIIVCSGCFSLSMPDETMHFLGLSCVSVGVGFFKPNTLSAVGDLFPHKAFNLRDSAYTTLYVGMNIGSFMGPLLCGWLGQVYGWEVVFPFLGCVILLASFMFYGALKDHSSFEGKHSYPFAHPVVSYVCVALALIFVFMALLYAPQMQWLMPVIILLSFGCLGIIFVKTSSQERQNVLQIGILMVLFALFCSVYEQTGSSITLFIERAVNRDLLGDFTIPTPFFQSVPPAFMMALGPLIANLWPRIDGKSNLGVFEKFSLGFFFTGGSFLVLGLAIEDGASTLLSPLWIFLVFFIQVVGEIFIIPIGFSAISTLAPKKFSSMIMGLWMVAIACGHYIAALLANFASLPSRQGENLALSLETYRSFFLQLSLIPFIVAFFIGFGIFLLKRVKRFSWN